MTTTPRWVDTRQGLAEVVEALRDAPEYALDTEFHRERTYHPRLALVQVAWDGGLAVLDPLAVEVGPLARVLEGPGLAVIHAAEQDLEVLRRACGAVPSRLFDTQVAAAFLGLGFASLARLVLAIARRRIPKGDRLTDWTRRPLDPAQIAYAAADVEHLLPIHRKLERRAREAGVLSWIEEECERLRKRETGPGEPETAWWRIKGSRSLRDAQRGVAQAVAAWRERRASERDLPPRFVLPDLALAGIAQRPPRSRAELRAVRGLDPRYLKGGAEAEILAAVREGLAVGPESLRRPPRGEAPEENLGPSVALGLALVAQLAAERGIEPSLLANRADVHALAAGRATGRLASGWRRELAGEALRALFAGEAALTGDGRGHVRLVALDGRGRPDQAGSAASRDGSRARPSSPRAPAAEAPVRARRDRGPGAG